MRLLILGGTTEANALCAALAGCPGVEPILSLAGRTHHPRLPQIPTRVGGFGGAEGLAGFLVSNGFEAVIDATHPFAARISGNAALACRELELPLARLERPAWVPQPGDNWHPVSDLAEAAAALGLEPRRVFLTTGRLELAPFRSAPQHHYLIRCVDPPEDADLPPDHQLILARGPFTVESETTLIREHAIDVLVTKNSGGDAVSAKLAAARALRVPVIMVERPSAAATHLVFTVEDALSWIAARTAHNAQAHAAGQNEADRLWRSQISK